MKNLRDLISRQTVWPDGKIIGGIYEIPRVIGRGGFGLVYEAHDHATHKDIAVKAPLVREEFEGSGQRRLVRFVESPSAKASLMEEVRVRMLLNHCQAAPVSNLQDDEHIRLQCGNALLMLDFIAGRAID
jgi:serine/threonine protein kinase